MNFSIKKCIAIISIFIMHWKDVVGIVPTGIIQTILPSGESISCVPGTFGKGLPEREDAMLLPPNTIVMPRNNIDGCRPDADAVDLLSNNFFWLIERGVCSFQEKAMNAFDAGASGVIVYNSLEGIYQNRSHASPTDFECNYGRSFVQDIIHPVWGEAMSESMPESCTHNKQCDSKMCVFTNRTTSEGAEVCCVFDMFLSMGSDSTIKNGGHLPIPIVFIRMRDYTSLRHPPIDGLFDVVMLFKRYEPFVDPSSILIWMLAVGIIGYAAIKAATEEEDMFNAEAITGMLIGPSPRPSPRPSPGLTRPVRQGLGQDAASHAPNQSTHLRSHTHINRQESPQNAADNTFEITPKHALLWAVCSACMLILLFYINLYKIVGLIYVVASAGASFLIFWRPLSVWLLSFHVPPGSLLETTATGIGLLFAKLLIIGWMVATYFDSMWVWIPQDVMGASVCIVAIAVIRLPNFKVATMLLGIMFCYDVFFVFISPYFFSSSIMLKVASGGKKAHNDENFCEKYPDHSDCQRNALPMLLLMPSTLSYSSDGSILGLGDVVLPGLLLAFTARLDTKLFGALQADPAVLRLWVSGSFLPTFAAYAIGLLLANFAVVVFETGQPALLYIVPLTLTAVAIWGWSRGCLRDLWTGPSVLFPQASNVVVVQEGEDQGLLDALPMAKKLHLANDMHIGRHASMSSSSSSQDGRRMTTMRSASARTERYQTMADAEYLEEDDDDSNDLAPI